jgi:aminocarboxymuconate-semialdehyde decarboxylase
MFSYWARSLDCLDLSRFLNDHIAALVEQYPRHYVGLGTLPMQDTELAMQELERCRKIGLHGVQIGSNINDLNLNEERFFPVFELCGKLGMAVLVHPWNMMGEKQMQRYWLPWLVGMPAETARAVCSMIFGGIFERLPQLRVNFAHGGGSFLATLGRIQHGFDCRPDLVAVDNPVAPRNYLGKFWVDTVVHDTELLKLVIKKMGAHRVAMGSDYPFPLGDLQLGKFIEDSDLDPQTREALFHHAALEWLALSKEKFE